MPVIRYLLAAWRRAGLSLDQVSDDLRANGFSEEKADRSRRLLGPLEAVKEKYFVHFPSENWAKIPNKIKIIDRRSPNYFDFSDERIIALQERRAPNLLRSSKCSEEGSENWA